MNFFGEPWDAPVCEDTPRVEVPVGQPCLRCGVAIEADDRGFMIPYARAGRKASVEPWHLACFAREVLGPVGSLVVDAVEGGG